MICPACRSAMVIVEYDDIELDYCTACKGVWFDAGELELDLGENKVLFKMLLQDTWEAGARSALP